MVYDEQLRQALERAFCSRFSVWTQDESWRPAMGGSADLQPCDRVEERLAAEMLAQHFRPAEIRVIELEGRCLAVVPLADRQDATGALCGFVDGDQSAMVRNLIGATITTVEQARRLDKLTDDLDAFVAQVTNDFEELTWLRNLAQNIDLCDVGNDMRTVARNVLPPLLELLQAETIALLSPLSIPGRNGSPAATCKEPLILGHARPRDQLERLIERLAPRAESLPLICNAPDENAFLAGFPGVRSCILVRLARQESQFGWLMVLNKAISTTPRTAASLSEWEFGTFEAGLVSAVSVMLAAHARNVELNRDKDAMLIGVIRALINAIDAKDTYTRGHSDRVALIARRLSEELGLSPTECERNYLTGLLHDVGKIGVPDEVLCKPGRLTEEEFALIKQHPEIGHTIIRHVSQLEYVLPGLLHHHESYDGQGYPHALVGEQIPLSGRILAVADAYDAMTSTRPYRTAMPTEEAEVILREGAGTQWDRRVVDAFFAALIEIRAITGSEDCPSGLDCTPLFSPACEPASGAYAVSEVESSSVC